MALRCLVETDRAIRPPHSEFRADIQGLRAIAVMAVVLYHADHSLLPGGFVGVDIFFVIAGFLIGGILMNELDRGAYSLAGFYRRRIRRLFPALYVMLDVVLAAGSILLPPLATRKESHPPTTNRIFIIMMVTIIFLAVRACWVRPYRSDAFYLAPTRVFELLIVVIVVRVALPAH